MSAALLDREAEYRAARLVEIHERDLPAWDAAHPRETAEKFRHQQAVWDLIIEAKHPITGEPLENKVREVLLVAPNQCGKTEAGGQVTGEKAAQQEGGRIWTGAETLSVSGDTIEDKLATYLAPHEVARWTNRDNRNGESEITVRDGARVLCKSYDQGRKRWQGVAVRFAWIDEQPPDEIVKELRIRCQRYGAPILYTFTALGGVASLLYEQFYVPFHEYMQEHGEPDGEPCHVCGYQEQGPFAVEIKPGRWVITARVRDNRFLDQEDLDGKERDLIDAGRFREARVRYHGTWEDIGEDPLIPIDSQKEWTDEPRDGYTATCYWLDAAQSAAADACRSSVAFAGRRSTGEIDLIDSVGGRFTPSERDQMIVAAVRRNGEAPAYVQRGNFDGAVAHSVNQALERAGLSTRFIEWPPKGTGQVVQGKLERAHQFSPLVASGIFRCRAEHVEYKRQAALASYDLLKKGAKTGVPIDDLDAAMGAALRLFEGAMPAVVAEMIAEAEQGGYKPSRQYSDREDEEPQHYDEPRDDDWAYPGNPFREQY